VRYICTLAANMLIKVEVDVMIQWQQCYDYTGPFSVSWEKLKFFFWVILCQLSQPINPPFQILLKFIMQIELFMLIPKNKYFWNWWKKHTKWLLFVVKEA